jgi:hypothetical protein
MKGKSGYEQPRENLSWKARKTLRQMFNGQLVLSFPAQS